eukprot:403359024
MKNQPKFQNQQHKQPRNPGGGEKQSDNPQLKDDEDGTGAFMAFSKNDLFKTLPIEERALEILYAIEKNNTTIIVGETGSGKSTKLPQLLYQAGYTQSKHTPTPDNQNSSLQPLNQATHNTTPNRKNQMIGLTLPKRVSVLNIASRLALNMNSPLGDLVGYSIRFDARYSEEHTKIKVLTDGMLLREMLIDPLLSSYSVLMIDDCHERSVYTDLILGLLKKIRRKRPNDLKIIISSATIEAQLFWRYFQEPPLFKAQVVEIEGRQYPVEILYLEHPCKDYVAQAVQTALTIHIKEELNSGDVLVFLTGQEEINQFIEQFNQIAQEKKISHSVYCLPCYANLPIEKQMKIFEPTPINKRKIVVATNIAETSITIENIVYVIDSCFVKIKHYDPHTNMDSLVIIPASKSACDQRAGRSGRVCPGKCFRLCTKEDYENNLPSQMKPEIQRTDTTQVVLQMKALGIRNLLSFDYLSPPSKENFIRALEVLYSLGALDDQAQLTQDIGLKLVEMPVDPRMAACILNSNREEWKITEEILSICALLSVQNLFLSVKDPYTIQKAKKKCGVIEGDHITLLNIFNTYNAKKSEGEKKGFCRECMVNEKSIKKAMQIKQQLKQYLRGLGIKQYKSDDYDDPEAILKCLITGYFANVAQRQTDGTYRNVRSMSDVLVIHPSSVLSNIRPKWILYHEIVVTSKKFMREVSEIKVEWLTELAPHFYVDKRKQIMEEQHKKETIRNLEHDWNKKDGPNGQQKELNDKLNDQSIAKQIQKQNNRFRKGMNFSAIDQESQAATNKLAIVQKSIKQYQDPINSMSIEEVNESHIFIHKEVDQIAGSDDKNISNSFKFKRQKISENQSGNVKSKQSGEVKQSKKPTVGLSFQDEEY